jgi:hypothetical protein
VEDVYGMMLLIWISMLKLVGYEFAFGSLTNGVLVDRTKGRPLPSGRITVPQALIFLSVHVILLFTILHFINQIS